MNAKTITANVVHCFQFKKVFLAIYMQKLFSKSNIFQFIKKDIQMSAFKGYSFIGHLKNTFYEENFLLPTEKNKYVSWQHFEVAIKARVFLSYNRNKTRSFWGTKNPYIRREDPLSVSAIFILWYDQVPVKAETYSISWSGLYHTKKFIWLPLLIFICIIKFHLKTLNIFSSFLRVKFGIFFNIHRFIQVDDP